MSVLGLDVMEAFSLAKKVSEMEFSEKEKHSLLKAFTTILKDAKGKGPRNIYVKYLSGEVHIVMQGIVTDFEKRLIKSFGEEALNILTDFYERDSWNIEKEFLALLNDAYPLSFFELESDLIRDEFVYKMKIGPGGR